MQNFTPIGATVADICNQTERKTATNIPFHTNVWRVISTAAHNILASFCILAQLDARFIYIRKVSLPVRRVFGRIMCEFWIGFARI